MNATEQRDDLRMLANVTAVITGAGRGIGRAIALEFARHGAAVVAVARTREEIDETAEIVRGLGTRSVAVECDVTVSDDVARLVDTVAAEFGHANVLVNGAGVFRAARFEDADLSLFREAMEVNYFGTIRVTQGFLPSMLAARSGRIVNIASTAGKWGAPFQTMYNSSKHAMVGLTRCLALEVAAHGIRVNAVCPAAVNTPFLGDALQKKAASGGRTVESVELEAKASIPIGRFIEPDEVARLAAFLAAGGVDAITGQAYTIDGGMVLV